MNKVYYSETPKHERDNIRNIAIFIGIFGMDGVSDGFVLSILTEA